MFIKLWSKLWYAFQNIERAVGIVWYCGMALGYNNNINSAAIHVRP